ncbi:twin-arginine translocation signal domain-containing protein [Vreelandella populi]|uniref:Twin-arginine translocation signal domain-containing protein n=2 Tax=Vreelandella populi TaxID=2498858 RepID=A0A3S0WQK8_9GAMM|nr:twin-arginine translocation signal domain-containing protein [Halomonas populi]RUR38031.1 twin-arginine translocation signal domain-containing protein [Halomonas populi]RUR49009.1 twin-arginine translocation signal domain-containing protein [Halomonas populi]RUR55352.1 twin-arginine translocation signal domain-containing protein [Halomonas populi]
MTSTYTRRRLLKTATFAGIGMALVPFTTLLPNAHATRQPLAAQAKKPTVMVGGWLLRASDR